jgi:hypothetical protein
MDSLNGVRVGLTRHAQERLHQRIGKELTLTEVRAGIASGKWFPAPGQREYFVLTAYDKTTLVFVVATHGDRLDVVTAYAPNDAWAPRLSGLRPWSFREIVRGLFGKTEASTPR